MVVAVVVTAAVMVVVVVILQLALLSARRFELWKVFSCFRMAGAVVLVQSYWRRRRRRWSGACVAGADLLLESQVQRRRLA